MIRKKLIIIIVIVLTINKLKAQSITELLQLAEQNNLALKALDQEYLVAREKGAQVGELPDPTVSVGVFPLPIETRLGPQRVKIGAMQTFPNSGMRKAKESALNYQADAKGQRIAIEQLALNFKIKRAYYQLYQLEKSQLIVQRNIRIMKALNQLTLTKVESGTGSAADVLKVNLKQQELQKQIEILDHQKKTPTTIINQLLDRDFATPIVVKDTLAIAVLAYDMETLANEIEDTHPLMKMYNFQKEASNQNLKVNRQNKRPVISAGIDYIVTDKIDFGDFPNNGRDAVMLKAGVRIPIFKDKYEAKQLEEELKIKALTTKQESAKSQFLGAINQAKIDFETIKLNLELYQTQIRTTAGIINVLETQYSAEGKGFDELLQMQISLVNYDLMILDAIVKSHIAKAEIERYLINGY